ncbi:CIA30 family protein [Anaerolineales bacterium HSG25]|nr:CIA30 family protein [Anaerolineales bacterium HSG25]
MQKRLVVMIALSFTFLMGAVLLLVQPNQVSANSPTDGPIIDNFEDGKLPLGTDANSISIGFVTWSDGSSVALTTTVIPAGDPLAMTNQTGSNTVLQMDSDINGWGGFTHAFENGTVDTWTPQNWSEYEGISFWLYGTGKGTSLMFELKENRNPGSTTDDAETWTHVLTDTTAGWRYIEIPFQGENGFTSKNIGNGAPNDGFDGTQMHGWAFGTLGSNGPQTHYLDNITLFKRVTPIDNFDDGKLPSGKDGNNLDIGFVTWKDTNTMTTVAITTTIVATNSSMTMPNQTGPNPVLKMDSNVITEAGFTHAFENSAVDTWTPQDWSSYKGISFWLYGTGNGTALFFDIKDNRNAGSTTDDAETWTHTFTDTTTGWRYIEVPFNDFVRKETGNSAPDDRFKRTTIHGWAFGSKASSGAQTHYLDNISVYGRSQKLEVSLDSDKYTVKEGETATIKVKLSVTSTVPVTVSYATKESGATDGRDYKAISGTLVFPPDSKEQSFTVETVQDNLDERKDEIIVFQLSNPQEADLGHQFRGTLVIQDDDATDMALLDNFDEGFYRYKAMGDVTLAVSEVMTGDGMALPGQGGYEGILNVTHTNAGEFNRTFPSAQDWSKREGLSFWYHGSNSGNTVTVNLHDNQASTTANTTSDKWVLRWSEEFSETTGTPPNNNIWTHEVGDGALVNNVGWGNSELQYYTDDSANASTDGNGNMVIKVLEEVSATTKLTCAYIPAENGSGNGPCGYTSARLITWDKAEFQYGRIEARAKVPAGVGLWPAFWGLGNDIFTGVPWPASGEIDVMEYVGQHPNDVLGTIHGPGYAGGTGVGGKHVFSNNVADTYHTFRVDWTPDGIKWYVDDINYFNATPSDIPADKDWVYDHPFFLILNVAVGGNLGGPVSATFPQELLVDYVRVYQAADSAERFESTFTDDFSGWQQVTVPFTSFVRAANQPTGAPDDNLGLNEVWGYGFKVDGAGSFKLNDVRLAGEAPVVEPPTTSLPLVDGFEYDTLPQGKDGTVEIGMITWADKGPETITLSTMPASGNLAVPGQTDGNRILKAETGDRGGWGGFNHAFANSSLNKWTPQDWTPYKDGGVCFWFYGTNSGTDMTTEIFDNRNPGSTTDDAQRWRATWQDDTEGWKQVKIPFADLKTEGFQPDDAPADDLDLNEVHGYAMHLPSNTTYYMDQISLYKAGEDCPGGGTTGNTKNIDNFEYDTIPKGKDANDNDVGLVNWGANADEVVLSTMSGAGVPDEAAGNRVLKVEAGDFGAYGGFTHAFENPAQNEWVSQDWTPYKDGGLCFWFKGPNAGNGMAIEIFDNRNPGSTVDDAERWEFTWTDDTDGWKQIDIPFSSFTRRTSWQPDGAPEDALDLDKVWGYAIGIPSTGTYYMDQVNLYAGGEECPGGGSEPVGNNLTLDNFELDAIPLGQDADEVPIGLTTWSGAGPDAVVLSIPTDAPPVPGQSAGNHVLKLEADFTDWGGMSRLFTNEAVDTWVSKDLTPYEDGGLCFWYYGNNTGSTVATEVFDNRNPDEISDTAERWEFEWADDFDGWKQIDISFSSFTRRTSWQPGNAPDDGFGLDKVHGYAMRLPSAGTYYMDDVIVYDTECPGSDGDGGGTEVVVSIDDFQSGVSEEIFGWSGGTMPTFESIQMDVPGLPSGTNNVLKIDYDISNYGGITHGFAETQDWTKYEGIKFWFKGTGSGLENIRFELKDGGTGEGTAELFVILITDDTEEWREFVVPWSEFTLRADYQPGGAPNDGVLELKEIWGYALGVDSSDAQGTWWLDDVALYGTGTGPSPDPGDKQAKLSFAKAADMVKEGDTATINVTIDVTATNDITVSYATSDIAPRGERAVDDKATAGSDYTPVSGTLTFKTGDPAGTAKSITIETLTDDTGEVGEAIRLTLSDPVNAELGDYDILDLYISAHDLPYLDPALPVAQRVTDLLNRMSIAEKAGQMTQIQQGALSSKPEVIADYYLGSLLSGGGGAPNTGNTVKDWADMYDRYQNYALATRLAVPLVYGVDAVHGHSNVDNATFFPHNIGLGATRNPALVEKIGRVTAVEVAVTGIDWTFSPCLCVARDERWGRTYESFGEDPEIASMMTSIIRGYQGDNLADRDTILASAKHWVADGGTLDGVNTGNAVMEEQELRDIHIAPYIPAIELDVATIMPSFSSWNGVKMHGHKYLMTDVLRDELGFEGFLISDWGGIDQIPGDYNSDVRTSINAGMDMVMVPGDYQKFTEALIQEVVDGNIPMSRIDHAVSLILAKKFELGLFEAPYTDRTNMDKFGSTEHRAVARQAVAESLVLLKNDSSRLPLDATQNLNILVAGSSADDMGNQLGGWSITWQGASGDTTAGTTIKEAIEKYVADKTATMTFNPTATGTLTGDVGIVVVGETPYAEGSGDAPKPEDLELSAEDKATVNAVCSAMDCVVILISGRPMIVTDQIDESNAFVAAWLPGSEGDGVADVLFGDKPFTGKLPMTWPRSYDQIPMNVGDADYDPLFAYGFGLTYQTDGSVPTAGVENLPLVGGASVTVPANAFGEDVTVRYTPIGSEDVGTMGHVGVFYDIKFVNSAGVSVQPTGNYTIKVPYDDNGIPTRIDETQLGLYYKDDTGNWVKESNCQVDTTNNFITCTVNHASEWAILFEDSSDISSTYLPVLLKQ